VEHDEYGRKYGPLNTATVRTNQLVLTQVKLYLALSRTPHGIIDMATPALAGLLWSGTFPPARIVWLGILTAFAGYTTVYALNDLVDYRIDKKRFENGLVPESPDDLDSIFIRHPMASGQLSVGRALLWTFGWALVTLFGAFLLNPFCVVIFLAACLLEAIYCLVWRSGYLKVFVSGVVKTSGAIAAIYAVDPNPSRLFLGIAFLWLFFWEVGGQNIPNDWADIEEDAVLQASTVPVRFGHAFTAYVILISLVLVLCFGCVTAVLSHVPNLWIYIMASVGAGFYFLLLPAIKLYMTRDRTAALALFNRASYYPAAILVIVIVASMI
jgi:4-hydroxybenzoate polyprenyltransferase